MPNPISRALGCALVALAAATVARPAGAQLPRAHLDWRTTETAHFRFHYPAAAEAWTREVASRMETVSEAVSALVGSRPAERVTVVVEDPLATSNGSAWPPLDRPLIYLWTTPAGPGSSIGHSRGWEEELAVHEYAHIAHLVRPSRNRRERFFLRFSPLPIGPIARRTPRWAIEGYATYVEGRLTGSGRPYGAARAAVLREWALEGRLPRYAELNGAGGYRGGELAYLAGSAFMEWLIARTDETTLPKVWRRLSARQPRGFDEAFAGVYGATPAALYGRFTAEVTGRALAAEQALGADSAGVGSLVLTPRGYGFDDPAVSPGDSLLAVRLRRPDRAGPVLVVRAAAETVTVRERRARERLLERDPEDVPAVDYRPRPHRVVARLEPTAEGGYEEPRFYRDGRRVLVSRWTALPDGAVRPDLYEWRLGGDVRRVTRGANVRGADPSPDGREAAAVRCEFGRCALVVVDLASGAWRVLLPAQLERVLDRARYSPDGRTIAVNVQQGGRWRVGLVDAASGALRLAGPDDRVSRYDAAFLADGRRAVVTSERGGVANLEELELATGDTRTITAVTGGAGSAAVGARDSLVYFLNLRGTGQELRQLALAAAAPTPSAVHDSALAPALPRRTTAVADTFARGAVPAGRTYGLGPSTVRWVPNVSGGSEGTVGVLAIARTDPVARLTAVAQAGLGNSYTWNGGALGATWRGRRPWVTGEAFAVRHEPRAPAYDTPGAPRTRLYAGGTASTTLENTYGWRTARYHLGASAGSLELRDSARTGRQLAFAEYAGDYRWRLPLLDGLDLGAATAVHGSAGRTGGESWRRGLATLAVRASALGVGVSAEGTYGAVGGGAPDFERFAAGGIDVPFVDRAVLAQRFVLPALPAGFAVGRRLASYRLGASWAGLTPYYQAITAADRIGGNWTRIVGTEQRLNIPPIGLIGMPALEIVSGIGYPLNGPRRHQLELYGGVTVRP